MMSTSKRSGLGITVSFLLLTSCEWLGLAPDEVESAEEVSGDKGTIASLQLTGPLTPLRAKQCLKLTVTGVDAAGTTILSDTSMVLRFSDSTGASKTGFFYDDSACTQTLSGNEKVLPEDSSSVEIYYKTLHVTTARVDVSSDGLEGVSWIQSIGSAADLLGIDMSAEPPNGDGTHTAGNCYGPYYIEPYDASLTAVRVNSDAATTVIFTEILGGDGHFYGALDTACTGAPATNATIPAGSTRTQAVYYKGTTDSVIEFDISATGLTGNQGFDH